MNKFEELLSSFSAKPATVLHLGAGSCKEYALYKALNSNRFIFVEPDEQLAKQASKKFEVMPDVTVINHAVATKKGIQPFNVFTNPRFSSLLRPAELLDYYPNITVTGRPEVETITLEQLCLENNIDSSVDNLLVAELQGLEKEIFPSIAKNVLGIFRWIIIRSSEHQLYEPVSDSTYRDITRTIQAAGYTVLTFTEDASPHTNILCIKNEAVIENTLLKERAASLDKSIHGLEQKLSEQESDYIRREDALNQQLADANLALQSKSEELAEALVQIQSIRTENENLSRDATEIAKELTEMQQTLRINNKLMLKSDADLHDLQIQYRAAIQHQEQQHKLLCELKERLAQASEFYRKLNLHNLVLDADMLDQDDSDDTEPLSSDDSRSKSVK